jgi:homoserine kinase
MRPCGVGVKSRTKVIMAAGIARSFRRSLAGLARLEARKSVTVRVPATSANMGPGFDCLGIALTEYNYLSVERASKFGLAIYGEGTESLPRDESNFYYRAFKLGFAASAPASTPVPPVQLHCTNAIPPARGLGSSSACLAAGVSAGFALNGFDPTDGQTRNRIFQICAEQEGHPDNVAPAIYGGLQLSFLPDPQGRFLTQRVQVHERVRDATAVLYVPDFELPTKEARALLKPEVTRCVHARPRATLPARARGARPAAIDCPNNSRPARPAPRPPPCCTPRTAGASRSADAVFNIARAATVVNAFASGELELLKWGSQDRLHQPQRGTLFPLFAVLDAAMGAGAHGSWLSGAGPTICAMVGGQTGANSGGRGGADAMGLFAINEVGAAMVKAAEAAGMKGRLVNAQIEHEGVQLCAFEHK